MVSPRFVRRFAGQEKAAAMVEFAMILPLFLLICWGVIDFGRLFFTSNSLASAAREGGRVAAVLPDPVVGIAQVRARARQSFVPFGGDTLKDSQIEVDVSSPGTVVVTIRNYPAPVITPLASLIGVTKTMTRKATFRREQSGT